MARMPLTWNDRLPGVAMRTRAVTATEDLLRMDVAGFVGFAERGPLNTPVMVEDISQYRATFGGDVFVARSKGLPVYAQLPRAVQAFFENNGRRCYVVRVAGSKARSNRFPIPGLVWWTRESDFHQASCPAASEGRWSDDVRVNTRLHSQPLLVERHKQSTACQLDLQIITETVKVTTDGIEHEERRESDRWLRLSVDVRVPKASVVRPGDLLLARFDDPARTHIYFRAGNVTQEGGASSEVGFIRTISLRVDSDEQDSSGVLALATRPRLPSLKQVHTLEYSFGGTADDDWHTDLSRRSLHEIVQPTDVSQKYTLRLRESAFDTLRGGTPDSQARYLRLGYTTGEQFVFQVTDVDQSDSQAVVECPTVQIGGMRGLKVEHLTRTGWVQRGSLRALSGLFYVPSADVFPYRLTLTASDALIGIGDVLRLGVLTTDGKGEAQSVRSFLLLVGNVDWDFPASGKPAMVISGAQWWEPHAPAQFTYADVPDAGQISLPAMASQFDQVDVLSFDLLARQGRSNTETWRDLGFTPAGDPASARLRYWEDVLARPLSGTEFSTTTERLLERSGLLHMPEPPAADRPRPVLLLPLMMSDRLPTKDSFVGPLPNEPHAHNGLDRYNPIETFLDPEFVRRDPEPVALGAMAVFALANDMIYLRDPSRRPIKLHSLYPVDQVSFIAIPDLGLRPWNRCVGRIIPPAPRPAPKDHSQFHPCRPPLVRKLRRSPLARLELRRLPQSEVAPEIDLFQQLNVLPELALQWEPCQMLDEVLLVHRAMIAMAGARGDLLAVLSLPYRYSVYDALDWHQQMVDGLPIPPSDTAPDDTGTDLTVVEPSLPTIFGAFSDEAAFSYSAAYFGWVTVREEYTPQLHPSRDIVPDGVVCGMIASRDLRRGPGVAPANEPLRAVIGLEPSVSDEQWEELFNRQINALHARPGRFVTLSAHTLSLDRQFVQISMRRMVIFLRKLVLQEGYRFVFESNDERFRRAVQVRFEQIFERLLAGGSVRAYAIDTGASLNTPYEIDNGRFIISIRVALTYPIEYITITLLRTSETLLQVSVR